MTLPGNALRDNLEMTPAPEFTAQSRQEARQADVPALYRTTLERLAVELALGMDEPEAIFAASGYTPEQAERLLETAHFKALLARVGTEIRENGVSFKMKIRAVAEDLIPHAHDLATDPLQSAAVRADIIKWAARMSGWEPSTKGDVLAGQGGFSLSITFAGAAPQNIITGRDPLTIEQEQ